MTALTFGRGFKNAEGKTVGHTVDLGVLPIIGLLDVLPMHRGEDAWVALGVYEGGHKKIEHWRSAAGCGVDLDWYSPQGEHVPLPEPVQEDVLSKLRARSLPGSVLHLTPRGLRLFFLYAAQVSDVELHRRCVTSAMDAVREAAIILNDGLEQSLGALGAFAIDQGASKDIARLLWAPNARIGGVQRSAELFVGPSGQINPEAFAAPVRVAETPQLRLVPAGPEHEGAAAYRAAALDNAVHRVRNADARVGRGRYDALNAEAFKLAQRGVDPQEAHHRLYEAAIGAGLSEYETRKALSTGLSDGAEHLIPIPDRPAPPRLRSSVPEPPFDDTPPVGDHAVPPSGDGPQSGGGAGRGGSGDGLTQLTLADRFIGQHGEDLRHCAELEGWLIWDQQRWVADRLGRVQELAKGLCRKIAKGLETPTVANRVASAAMIGAIDKLALTDPQVRRPVDAFDQDPWLLNTPGGVVDLKTGAVRPHKRSDHMTKLTGTAPGGRCPRWEAFLEEWSCGDGQLELWLQRYAGLALTAITKEQIFAYFWGEGANGKGVIFTLLSEALGDYAQASTIETWMAAQRNGLNEDLVPFVGARLVAADEPSEDQRWDSGRLKLVSGGTPIRCRAIYSKWFEYRPSFKLWLSGNRRPKLGSVDAGIRRRFRLIPCEADREKREDKNLTDKLRAELPGILSWAIEGCLDWQRNGLPQVERIEMATETYLEEQDPVQEWIETCCDTTDKHAETPIAELFRSWAAFAKPRRFYVGDAKRLSSALSEKRYKTLKRGKRGDRYKLGISLPVFNSPHPAVGDRDD